MANGHIIEGIVATIGGILLFIGGHTALVKLGVLDKYYYIIMGLGFALLWWRSNITRRIIGLP